MSILCGTDFSDASRVAVRAAAAWAMRTGTTLELAHVVDLHGALALVPQGAGAYSAIEAELVAWKERATVRLADEARACASFGVVPSTVLLEGASDVALVAHARRTRAETIVVSAVGSRAGSPFTLGSTADRVAQSSEVPVLVVRDATPIEAWARGTAPLTVLVAFDESSTACAAMRWSVALAARGSVELASVHVYWPPAERGRGTGAMPIGTGHAAVEKEVRERLVSCAAPHAGGRAIEFDLVGGMGRTAEHVAQAAEHRRSGLVVVGSHQRGGLARFWHGSVSHGVVDRSRSNVMVVPERA